MYACLEVRPHSACIICELLFLLTDDKNVTRHGKINHYIINLWLCTY